MWCRSVQRQIVPYVDGRLAGRRHAAVAGHLEHCRSCSATADELREINALLDSEPEAPVPSEFEAEVIRRIRGIDTESFTPEFGKWLLPLAASACAVGVALYIGHHQQGPRHGPGDVEPTVVARAPSPTRSTAAPANSTRAAEAGVRAAPQVAARREAPGAEGDEAPLEPSGREQAVAGVFKKLPPDLFNALDLFVDFPIIQELEKFEHYETIWASPGKSGSTTRGG